MKIVGISLLLITRENYQMRKDRIEDGWYIQKILTKYIVFVANYLVKI